MAPKANKVQKESAASERTAYTATLTPVVLHDSRGNQLGRPVIELRAVDEAEVEAILKDRGHTWQSIAIVKGINPGLTRTGGMDRYTAELQSMMAHGSKGPRLASGGQPYSPSPYWVGGNPSHDPDATARTGWAKFMEESSHGLSVSDFPRFVLCDGYGSQALSLPSEAVKEERRWGAITAVVRQQLDYWKASLQVDIDELGKVERRSAEQAEQLKESKAALKALKGFDGWDYQRYVEHLLPGREPHVLDLDNPRLYRLSGAHLIPIGGLGKDLLRTDFWRRLLALWDGPMDKRADNVRAFLNHHHRNGRKPEQFRDLVKDTLPRLRNLTGRELLVDKLEGWLQRASAPSSSVKRTELQAMPFEREAAAQFAQLLRDELPGFSICPFPRFISIGTRETYPNVLPGIEAMDVGVRSVENWKLHDKAIREAAARKLPDGELKDMVTEWTYASIVPEGLPNPFDIPNPRAYLLDGALIPSERFNIRGRLSNAANHAFVKFQSQLKQAWISPMNLRKARVAEYLDHHFANGGNPNAFVDFVEDAGPSMMSNGKTKWPAYDPQLQKELAAWLVTARKRLGGGAKMNGKPNAQKPTAPTMASKVRTLAERLDAKQGAREAFDELLRMDGITNKAGLCVLKSRKGKGEILANWDAVVEHFGLEGYAHDRGLADALMDYISGLTIQQRIGKLREGNVYKDGFRSSQKHLRG